MQHEDRDADALQRELTELRGQLSAAHQKQAESDMRHALEIDQAQRSRNLAYDTLSHELRTPMAAIMNAVEVLRRPELGDELRARALAIIERNLRRQVELVEDLLDLSRLMQGNVALRRAPLDLGELAASCARNRQAEANQRGLRFDVAVPTEPLIVLGDRERIAQVLDHLLENAFRFTPSGGGVSFRASGEGEQALVEVSDTGSGIGPDMLPKIFEPFQQADTSLARRMGGLGVGLSIARVLVEAHQGAITAHSAGLGRGTNVQVRLPVMRQSASRRWRPRPAQPTARRGRRVLVVEDNADVLETLVVLLKAMGHEPLAAPTGSAAVEAAEREQPDVALIDIGLPDITGYEVARRLRQRPALRRLRLVALTGYTSDEHRRQARDAGFNEFLSKPIGREVLQRAVAEG